MKKDKHYIGLDIGTSKVCAIICEATAEEGKLEIIGIGSFESKGLKKGSIINLDATVHSIKKAVEEAELMAGISAEAAYVGIAGGHIRGFNSRGVITVSHKNREITEDDVQRVIDAAKSVQIPEDREILHLIPQEFIVDDQCGIADPVGMRGSRLEVRVHIVTGAITSIQNVITCVNRAGIEVMDTVLVQLAASEALLSEDEKELGAGLVDIGGGTTDLAVFHNGSICHTAVLPFGGDHFTNDIAVGLRAPIPEAGKIKVRYGCAMKSLIDEDDTIEVPTVGGRKPKLLSRQVLCEIIQPRAEEIFSLVSREIEKAGYEEIMNAGLVLTGGSSLLEGIADVAEQVFDLPIRIGLPGGMGGLIDVVNSPKYAVAVGLVQFGFHNRGGREIGRLGNGKLIGRMAHRFKNLFAEIF
jgi:cell division protein FtsA